MSHSGPVYPMTAHRIHWLALGLVLLLTALAYAPGLGGPILFDDRPNLTANQSETLKLRNEAAAAVGSVSHNIRKGEVIVRKGAKVDE